MLPVARCGRRRWLAENCDFFSSSFAIGRTAAGVLQ
jgi:hypothetical protein